MLNMNSKLRKRQEEGKVIHTGIVGAGQMGRGLITQMIITNGMTPSIVSDIKVENAVSALKYSKAPESDIVVARTLEEANRYMEKGKYVACEDSSFVTKANLVDCVIDATGLPDVGAKVATEAIENKKHVVMLNVETDVVIGPYLKRLADRAGVVYTGTAGDEPGAVMELYCFADAIGLDIKVIGKGKNNEIDLACNPDTTREEAEQRLMSPRMLCSFKDGTKTMVELAAMSNATGFVPDVIGTHGVESDVDGLNTLFHLKEDGGILSRHRVVEYVVGIAPGVFATVSTDNDEVTYQMSYLKMGSGPLWTLYRPYHLCSLETPLTVAKCVIEHEHTIVPKAGLVSECIVVAKTDLNAGQLLDGIGGFCTYGSIATKEVSDMNRYVPYGLINNNAKVIRSVKKGQLLTLDDVRLDTSTLIYALRKEQDSMTF